MITQNNFSDNALAFVPQCAVQGLGTHPVNAERNFWGSAQGPGFTRGSVACTESGPIDTEPFLTRPVTVTNQAGR